MPAAEIKALRQSGKLEEALAMAQNELNANPENIWGKRNISWVYYEYLKKYAQEVNLEGFIENLIKIKELNLPEEEVMIFDTSAYQIGSIMFKIQNSESINYSIINKIFDIIKSFHFTKPSEAYSLLHKAFIKNYKNWPNYIAFADWWGYENFRPEDFQHEEFNGRQIMSLAEKSYIAYAKKLLEGEALDDFGNERKLDLEKIEEFIPKLNNVIEKYPAYQYPTYYRTQLLLALGKKDIALESFLPFVKLKKNDFWVWQLLAEIFKDDKNIQLSCYCKALSLRTNEDFIVKLREDFAALLIELNLLKEAKTEIKQAIATRQNKEWKMSHRLTQWSNEEWYQEAQENSSNKGFYQKNLAKAEEILYQDIPVEIIVVEYINRDKNILNFIQDKSKTGFFNYSGLNINPSVGDILKVRFDKSTEGNFYRVLTAETAENVSSEALRNFTGEIRLHEKGFGFADDVFISKNFVDENKIEHGQFIEGIAILSFNKSREEWSWKALKLIKKNKKDI